jgi:hypothetical protein
MALEVPMRPADSDCEAFNSGLWGQPANAATSLAFVVVGVLIIIVNRKGPSSRVIYGVLAAFLWSEFFPEALGFINELKLRGSWGRTGNQDIVVNNNQVYYPYFSSITAGHTYLFGETLTMNQGMAQVAFANRDISWESTEMRNIGLDLEMLSGRLSFIGELYQKDTDGILLALPIPGLIGLDAPVQNAAEIRNTGWEAAVNWRDRVGGVNYSVGIKM